MFGLAKPYFLGVDFGTSSIKAVELTLKQGKPYLSNFGQVDLGSLEKGQLSSPESSYDEEIVLYLKALLQRFKPKSDSASVAMPAFIGLISLIEFPEMQEKELEEAIQFEAHKYIPSPLEDIALSWDVVGMRPASEGNSPRMEVLLVAALKKEVERYRSYTEAVDLKMDFLELETFSLVRSIVGDEPGLRLVVDIGSRATNLVLVESGIVRVSRNLDTGGKDLTRTIMESLSITQERAEELKKSGKDLLNSPESALVFPSLQMIGSEAQRMLASYKAKYPDVDCQEIILSGGTAHLFGINEYFSKLLSLPVALGNPWKRIAYHPSKASEVERLGTSFSVSLGLALSTFDAIQREKTKKKQGSGVSLQKILNKKL